MRRVLLILLSCCLLVLFGTAQESITISSDANDLSRPVSTLLDQLRSREHVLATYEDPRYANTSDTVDVTAKVSSGRLGTQGNYVHPIIVPKGRPLTFVYAPKDVTGLDGQRKTIARMLAEYRMAGGPKFAVITDGPRLHVVPEEVLNVAGERTRQTSILETPITVARAPRDGTDLLQAICDEIGRRTGFDIGIGPSAPINNLSEFRTTEGFENVTARSAIEHLLDQSTTSASFVWDLYYDPGDKSYGLNFVYVGAAAAHH